MGDRRINSSEDSGPRSTGNAHQDRKSRSIFLKSKITEVRWPGAPSGTRHRRIALAWGVSALNYGALSTVALPLPAAPTPAVCHTQHLEYPTLRPRLSLVNIEDHQTAGLDAAAITGV